MASGKRQTTVRLRQKQVRITVRMLSGWGQVRVRNLRYAALMCEAPLDLENLRRALELSVERAEAYTLHLARAEAPRKLLIEAQDDWSDAVSNLAAYLLATGEPGWVGSTRPPVYGSTSATEVRPA